MKKGILPAATLIILVVLLLLGSSSLAKGPEKVWIAEYTFDIPDGTWDVGTHTYHIETVWTYPESASWMSDVWEFEISEDAPMYDGYALLRVGTGFVRIPPPQTHCEQLDEFVLHPDQAKRFHLGWDWEAKQVEARAHYDSLTVTITWDDGAGSAELERHEIFAYPGGNAWDRKWHNAKCNWTHRP